MAMIKKILILLISLATLSSSMKWPRNSTPLEVWADQSVAHHCKLCNEIAKSASDGAKWLQKLDEDYFSLLKFCMDELRKSDDQTAPSVAGDIHHQFLFACHGFTADKRKLREAIEAKMAKKDSEFCGEQKNCGTF